MIINDPDLLRALVQAAEESKANRAAKMPTEKDAIRTMFDAWTRLTELGWRAAVYCPKDGSEFSVIEPGSTGIHKCVYSGDWPDGQLMILDGDAWPSHPVLWRERRPDDPEVNLGTVVDYRCGGKGAL